VGRSEEAKSWDKSADLHKFATRFYISAVILKDSIGGREVGDDYGL
jgi:hypothetical protein